VGEEKRREEATRVEKAFISSSDATTNHGSYFGPLIAHKRDKSGR